MDTAKVEVQKTTRFYVYGAAGTSSAVQWPSASHKPLAQSKGVKQQQQDKQHKEMASKDADRVSLFTTTARLHVAPTAAVASPGSVCVTARMVVVASPRIPGEKVGF